MGLTAVHMHSDAEPSKEHRIWCVDARDAGYLYHQIFDLECYGGHDIHLQPGDVIIDVGANIGVFLLWIARRLPRMTYYAVEPIPSIFQALERNASALDQEIYCLQHGLADHDGEVTFEYLPRTPCCSTMYPAQKSTREDREQSKRFTEQRIHQTVPSWLSHVIRAMPGAAQRLLVNRVEAHYAKSIPVSCQVRTLSHMIDEHNIECVDLLKIDAERAELDILRGIEPRHWARIRQLILEVHYPQDQRNAELVELLERHGFAIRDDRNPTNEDSRVLFLTRTDS